MMLLVTDSSYLAYYLGMNMMNMMNIYPDYWNPVVEYRERDQWYLIDTVYSRRPKTQ